MFGQEPVFGSCLLQPVEIKANWNVMVHAQKPDFVFRGNGRIHLNRRGRQFIRLLAAKLCASAVVMLDILCSEVVWRVLATHSIRQFPLHFPSLASPCAITFQLESTTILKDFKSSYSLYVCLSLSLSLSLLNGCTVEHSSIIAPRTRGAQ